MFRHGIRYDTGATANDVRSEQLKEYSNKMKDIKTGTLHLESVDFNKKAAVVQREVQGLRKLHQVDYNALQSDAEARNSEVKSCEMTNKRLTKATEDLKERIASQALLNSKLDNQVNMIRDCIDRKDRVISQKKRDLQENNEFDEKRPTSAGQLSRAKRESVKLKARIEEETQLNRETGNTVLQLRERAELNNLAAEHRNTQIQGRLSEVSGAILNLEQRAKQLAGPERHHQMAEILTLATSNADEEMHRYRRELDDTYSTQLNRLKLQMESGRTAHNIAGSDNIRLVGYVDQLNHRIQRLQEQLERLENPAEFPEPLPGSSKQVKELESAMQNIQQSTLKTTENIDRLNATIQYTGPDTNQHEEGYGRPSLDSAQCDGNTQYPLSPYHLPHPSSVSKSKQGPRNPSTRSLGCRTDTVSSVDIPEFEQFSPLEYSPALTPTAAAQTQTPFPLSSQVKSAPASASPYVSIQRRMTPSELGQGQNYFQEMFQQTPKYDPVRSARLTGRRCVIDESSPRSSLGVLSIHEIGNDGRYLMLHNTSHTTDVEIGGYSVRQHIAGIPVTHYRLPLRMTFVAGSFITIFAGVCSSELHQPPQQFVRNEEERWGTGAECTTVLCNAAGKAVAWMNAPHKHSRLPENEVNPYSRSVEHPISLRPLSSKTKQRVEEGSPPCDNQNANLYLRRLRNCVGNRVPRFPVRFKQQSPMKEMSSDSLPVTPEPKTGPRISGHRPLHSATGLRMGSAPLRRFVPSTAAASPL